MKDPKVSIIIPVYNVKKYLKKCIESIVNQTFRDIEIIIINDGSTDGSCKLLAQMKDERIVIINKENEGLSSARNVGIEMAKGKYLAFVDSDDWVASEYIEKMYDVCEKYDCDIVQCSYEDVYSEDIGISEETKNVTPMFYSGKEFSYATYTLLSWECNLSWNKLYRRELFEEIRFPKGKIHEDEFTTYKIVWNSCKIGVISNKLYYYRHRAGSIMQQTYNKDRLDASIAFFERADFYKDRGEVELAYLTQKRHLDWVGVQKKMLSSVINNSKNDILFYLESTEEKLKKELEEWKFKEPVKRIMGGVFPFSKVEKDSNVILYGGGDFGRQYYRQVSSQNYCNIVLWVDKNVEKCRMHGIPVESVEQIYNISKAWDYVVIAIDNPVIVGEVIHTLIEEYGIPIEKIVY